MVNLVVGKYDDLRVDERPLWSLMLQMKIAQERAKIMRRITSAFYQLARSSEVLRSAGLGDAQLAQLADWNFQLHLSFERMSNIKEYRWVHNVQFGCTINQHNVPLPLCQHC